MHEIRVSSKGQLVIPKYMRDAAGMKTGSIVLASLEGGRIILVPKPGDPLEALKKTGEELSLKNIRREIKKE
ncbi:MAG: AbrB/MazE/SpoVT family DNA-binding domain-containing protein [Candidatus Aenigmarchaeota archaeon]|nr:AbrB/MazE/SpoVT family DNA-binding domain-containing protein [Candidatus Aenigmarchaeota archaeon]